MGQQIVISVHGIRTYGQWQQRLGTLLKSQDPTIEYHAYSYGYFSVVAFLIPPLRWLIVKRFRAQLLRVTHRRTDAEVSLIGHSFGTHIIGWALLGLPSYLRPKVRTVIFAGSVLSQNFSWNELLTSGDVERVVNDCGVSDSVLAVNRLVVLGTGIAGRFGFTGFTGYNMFNRYFVGGHSLYFEDSSGSPRNDFMERYWIPMLAKKDSPISVDERRPLTLWQGIIQTILQNAELPKFLLYGGILALPVILYSNLYLSVIAEKQQLTEARNAQLKTIEWAFNNSFYFPYDSSQPDTVAHDAQGLLDDFLDKLDGIGFDGKVTIVGHTGKFCTKRSSAVLMDAKARSCESGLTREYAIGLGERQAQAFRRLLLLRNIDETRISTVSFGTERPRYCYPDPMKSAGEQNRIALLNNRMEIRLRPNDAAPDRPFDNYGDCLPAPAKTTF
jgi:outer membrane protein OmpA-like peptidoglycan-associated protein